MKENRGRRRYILFTIEEGETVSDEQLAAALRPLKTEMGDRPLKLIQFNGRYGIVRVPGDLMKRSKEALNAIRKDEGASFSIKTLKTSGTLRTLREL